MLGIKKKDCLPDEIETRFETYYYKNLEKFYASLEPRRVQYIKNLKIVGSFFGFFGLIILGLIHNAWEKGNYDFARNVCLILFIFGGIVCLVLFAFWQSYQKDAKFLVMDKIMEFFGNVEFCHQQQPVPLEDIQKSDLFTDITKEICDDSFLMHWEDKTVRIAEQKLFASTYSFNGARYISVFHGVFVLADFDKKFSGKIVAKDTSKTGSDLFCDIMMGGVWVIFLLMALFYVLLWVLLNVGDPLIFAPVVLLFIWNCYKAYRKKYKKVNLEDIVFSKIWKLDATNQVEARYILTPALMERILKIKKMFRGQRVHFAFFENKLLMAIDCDGNMFETTSLFSSALNYKKVRNVIAQLYSIFAIIKDIEQSTLDKLQKK